MARRGIVALGVLIALGCRAPGSAGPGRLTAEEHNDLGVARAAGGNFQGAAQAFTAALARRPGWSAALRNLGDARLALGDVDGALAAYEAAHRVAPRDPAIANNLAWALLQHPDRWPEAELLITAALDRDPEPRGFYLDTLGLLRVRQGAYGAALLAFRGALADPALDGATRAQVLGRAALALDGLGDRAGAARCRALARTGHAEVGAGDPMC